MKRTILEFEDFKQIIPVFQSPAGQLLLKILMAVVGIDNVNALYGHSAHLEGTAFLDSVLAELGISYRVENKAVLDALPQGSFITVSNHPYGALDGVVLIRVLIDQYPDFKVMVNWILMHIETLVPYLIGVLPTSSDLKMNRVTLSGIKASIAHIRDGHPLGFFPAGAVSKYTFSFRVEDREWQPNVIRLIRQARVPVVPIYFHGHNSAFYNALGLFSWRLRTLRLPRELFNKRGKTIELTIGDPISVEQIRAFSSDAGLASFLRARTYQTGQNGRY